MRRNAQVEEKIWTAWIKLCNPYRFVICPSNSFCKLPIFAAISTWYDLHSTRSVLPLMDMEFIVRVQKYKSTTTKNAKYSREVLSFVFNFLLLTFFSLQTEEASPQNFTNRLWYGSNLLIWIRVWQLTETQMLSQSLQVLVKQEPFAAFKAFQNSSPEKIFTDWIFQTERKYFSVRSFLGWDFYMEVECSIIFL